MQFNCVRGIKENTIYEDMRKKFNKAGFNLPKVIFWNLNAYYGNFPVMEDEPNCCMVSGFSPNIIKPIITGDIITPFDVMLRAIQPFVEMLKK